MTSTNPNGSNQHVLDPRQNLAWNYYTNPKSETFGNAYQSAVKAGYEETTATQITVRPWFLEKVRRMGLLQKAEKVLDETLDMDINDSKGEKDAGLVRVKADVAKFIASTQGKNEGYSNRTELTGKDGGAIVGFNYLPPEKKDNADNADDQTND